MHDIHGQILVVVGACTNLRSILRISTGRGQTRTAGASGASGDARSFLLVPNPEVLGSPGHARRQGVAGRTPAERCGAAERCGRTGRPGPVLLDAHVHGGGPLSVGGLPGKGLVQTDCISPKGW